MMKEIGIIALGALIALVAYDMFVKKALKLDTYENYDDDYDEE